MSKPFFLPLLLLLSIAFFISCRSKKPVARVEKKTVVTDLKPTPEETLLQAIEANRNDFSYLNARGQVSIKDGGSENELDINLVMEKDKYVFINLSYFIPVLRVWIAGDSVSMLDLVHRKYIQTDFSFLQKQTNIRLTLASLQQMLTGNAIFSPKNLKPKIDTVLQYILVAAPLETGQLQTLFYNPSNLKVLRSQVTDKTNGQEVNVTYDNLLSQGNNAFPQKININIRAEKNIECKFKLSNFVFEKKKETQFVIPKNYTKVRL